MREKYTEERKWLNEYLDAPSSLRPLSRRKVLDVLVYGGLAHTNQKKKKMFDKLMENSISRGLTELEFASILLDALQVIQSVAKLNVKVIAQLETT